MGYRQDKDITRQLPGFRRILAHLTPSRQAASVYMTQTVDLGRTLPWIEEYNQKTKRKVNFLKLFLIGAGRMVLENPRLNRYASGHRIYQRDGVYFSVSAKKKLKNDSKSILLKLPIHEANTLEKIDDLMRTRLEEGRSKDIHQEKEMDFFLKVPSFVLQWMIRLLNWLDRRHWLPGFFVDPDPLFCSVIVANLGSIGMNAVYHHLYEYGNCPFFCAIGRVRDEIYVENGIAKTKPVVDIKYTFDERIEDGLACAIALAGLKEILENPDRLGEAVTDLQGGPPKAI